MMAEVAMATEAAFREKSNIAHTDGKMPVSDSVAQAACFLAERLGAKVIIASTESGFTARMISSFRPRCPILGVTPSENVARRMALFHGVCPVKGQAMKSIDQTIEHGVAQARAMGLIRKGDLAVITAGTPIGVTGTTNLIKVHVA
jgi:pyruvate kinase